MRTNIVIDDDLMREAMEFSGLRTKKDTVDLALREFVARRRRRNLFDIAGKVQFADGYDHRQMRAEAG